ncbi:DEAD/DEAH box helicase domain protein [Spirochaeta thermophila DSM 6578]|uniref:DEAD/DEAH box helicase domain protein n=1 Tax=Winmispira thermophila (strain ATCC 700085 / DSM 6578 / Z-1203) TaxID=869211 RepID=G0GAK3_WINT7|nr:DEAD/DEAH box helicase [Spirochaeta thermophila]AEJ60968.1 DEAD/DEAH box helicase domain protein [Spirochaeta thermophila DSM 6578]
MGPKYCEILVVNTPPSLSKGKEIPSSYKELFCRYFNRKDILPFEHQARVFSEIQNDREVFLVAGTAAGKTLAVAIPLFQKVISKQIQKVLLLYPTVALLEDQRKVLMRLSEIIKENQKETTIEIGELKGGLTQKELLEALTKDIILATPDEIYWFFRKNVKYNSLLIYGLSLVDEFVLDEAHLFNGLMLENFKHLWRRIKSLAGILGKTPRLHILTATPTAALQGLNNGIRVVGRSKCQDVTVEIRPSGPFGRAVAMVDALNESLEQGRKKILVVCNSARRAHQLFEKYKRKASGLPVKYQLRFGKVQLGNLLKWLENSGVEQTLLDNLRAGFYQEEEITLSEVAPDTSVKLPVEKIIESVTDILERQCWYIKRILWEQKQKPGETWESLLHNRRLPCTIIGFIRNRLMEANLDQQQVLIDEWLADTLRNLEDISEDEVITTSPNFRELAKVLENAGLDSTLADLLVNRLVHQLKVDPGETDLESIDINDRPIYLRWLDWMVEKSQVDHIRTLVQTGLESGALKADCRHIGVWKETDVPVIVYSGSMAKRAREGLIEAFADLERAVLISTSAVEVGVDFAADTLITEECEGNSFLQRFGRVGRHGNDSRVIVLVSGDVAAEWQDLNGQKMSREEFSQKILATFPTRSYAEASPLVDAAHYLVNEQLGRIGMRLNQDPALVAAQSLADKLRAAEIPIGFGLRSTMPQITLRDGVGKDPFYVLRYVDDDDLRPANSPFEVAQANKWFTELLFQSARFRVMVDLKATLRTSRVWFWLANGEWQLRVQTGVGSHYIARMKKYFPQQRTWDPFQPGNFLLLHGDVYLQRAEKDITYPKPDPVCDDQQDPLCIPAQNYLVFIGWDDVEKAQELLTGSPISRWEELYYDWDGVEFNNSLVVLEQTAGACFAAYEEWLKYVNQRVQK